MKPIKIGETAKQIETFLKFKSKPYYFGETTTYDDKKGRWNIVNSTFIARKYSHIIELVNDIKPDITVENDLILIRYNEGKGEIKIGRDLLVDEFLLPLLKQNITA